MSVRRIGLTRTGPIATGQVTIAASPAEVYRLISDPPAMAAFTVEFFRAKWLGGAREAKVGARFRGMNRNGWRRWWTICTVTEAEPGRRFAYEVSTPFKVPISRWEYDLKPAGDGCTITESSFLRVPDWFIPFAILITGEPDRPGANKAHISVTLDRLKAHLEAQEAA
jgi:uncharacterized protein YndB with AHSA1/START domain